MTRDEYLAIIAARTQQNADDPEADHAVGCLNQAVLRYQQEQRIGWDWLWYDVTLTTVAEQQTYDFADIAALVSINEGLDVLYPVRRIKEVALETSGGGPVPLERASRRELADRFTQFTSSMFPAAWTTEGRRLYLYPTPDSEVDLDLRVLVGEKSLADADAEPLIPDEYAGVVIEFARMLVYQDLRDVARAADARAAYRDELALAKTDMSHSGPGRPTLEAR